MKISAKNLKVGQIVKYINVWVKIESLKNAEAKNGRPYVAIIGTQLPGVIRRRGGGRSVCEEIKNFTVEYWSETLVTTK